MQEAGAIMEIQSVLKPKKRKCDECTYKVISKAAVYDYLYLYLACKNCGHKEKIKLQA